MCNDNPKTGKGSTVRPNHTNVLERGNRIRNKRLLNVGKFLHVQTRRAKMAAPMAPIAEFAIILLADEVLDVDWLGLPEVEVVPEVPAPVPPPVDLLFSSKTSR